MQASQMHILRDSSLLTSLTIEGNLELRPDEQRAFKDLSGLQVRSPPARDSLAYHMRDVRLPGSLTSLSIDWLMLDTDCWNWEAIPDTLHSIHLADIHIASRSHLTWLQQLPSKGFHPSCVYAMWLLSLRR